MFLKYFCYHSSDRKLVYRYTMLNHGDTQSDDVENELGTHTSLYEDSSDEVSLTNTHGTCSSHFTWLPKIGIHSGLVQFILGIISNLWSFKLCMLYWFEEN